MTDSCGETKVLYVGDASENSGGFGDTASTVTCTDGQESLRDQILELFDQSHSLAQELLLGFKNTQELHLAAFERSLDTMASKQREALMVLCNTDRHSRSSSCSSTFADVQPRQTLKEIPETFSELRDPTFTHAPWSAACGTSDDRE